MKKYFYSVLAASMLFACSQEDIVDVTKGEGQQVTFKVEIPKVESRTVGGIEIGKGTQADQLIYAMYETGKDEVLISDVVTDGDGDANDGTFTVTVPMAKDIKYDLLFLAYNPSNTAFDIASDPKATNLKNLQFKANQTANIDAFDAFVGSLKEQGVADANNVTLKRPFAQVNAATTETDMKNAETLKLNVAKSSLVIEGVPASYNVLEGTASGSVNVTYAASAIMMCDDDGTNQTYPNEIITVDGTNYYYLTLAYVLAGETTTTSTHNATFQFQRADGTSVSTLEIISLPLQRNYRTNVIGDLLTKSEEYTITIDAEFGGEHTNGLIPGWDGKTMTEPQKDANTGAYLVSTPEEYAWLFNYSNPISRAGTSLTGIIEIKDNIDLSGYEIAGIAAASNGELQVNGNGYKISNAVVRSGDNDNGTRTSGLFVSLSNSKLTVQDLNVENVSAIAGDTYEERDWTPSAGIICGYVEGTLNVKNVKVSASKAHGLHSNGGLIGFIAANGDVTVENCTVDGMVLTNTDVADESGAMGGLVGRVAGKLTVNGAKVSNTTIEAYVGTDSEQKRSISKYIGNLVGGAVVEITDAAIENVTMVAKNELAKTQSCLYGDFLGGWRGTGGSVTINGVSIEKGESPFITTAEELSSALNNAADGATIGIGATIETKSLGSTGKNITIVGMTEDACIDASASGFSTWTNVTAKNLTIKFNSSVIYYNTGINGSGTLTFDNCDFEGIATSMNGTFVYNKCTFTNTTEGKYAAWVYSGKATYNDCTFTGVDRAAKVYTEKGFSAEATYNSCTFNSSEANKAAVEVDATNNNGQSNAVWYTINIDNAIINGLGKGEFTGSEYCNIEGTNVTVNVDGKAISQLVRIGNTAYTSLSAAISAAQEDDVILLADGTYEGEVDLTGKKLSIEAVENESVTLKGLVWADNCTVTLKGLTLTNPDGVQHPNSQNSQYYSTINNQYPVVGAYNNVDITFENCTFELTGPTVYGFYGYALNSPKFKSCTFNCNKIRPIANNGPSMEVTGCTFKDQYHYSVRIFEHSGEKQTVVYTDNVVTGSNDKGEFEGINISKKGNTATVLGDFTIKGNTKNLKFRHHKNVTMSDQCTYNTDITDFAFEKEQD